MTKIVNRRAVPSRGRIAAVGAVAAIALTAAGCGGTPGSQGGYGASPAKPAGAGSGAASITLADSNLGKLLVNHAGRTLYLFKADTGSTSTCNDACASAWPPVITHGAPIAATGLSNAKLGTSKRSDGATQVTYNGHPLYTFTGDHSPGDATGEGVDAFGAEWYVVSPAGDEIDAG